LFSRVDAEVEQDGLGVADVQVAVGLGGSGDDPRIALFGDVGRDNIADEVGGSGRGCDGLERAINGKLRNPAVRCNAAISEARTGRPNGWVRKISFAFV